MEAHGHAARYDASACGAALARAEQTFDRAAREDDPHAVADLLNALREACATDEATTLLNRAASVTLDNPYAVARRAERLAGGGGGAAACGAFAPPARRGHVLYFPRAG